MIHRFAVTLGEREHEVTVEVLEGGRHRITVDGRTRELDARSVERGVFSLIDPGGGTARLLDVSGRSPDLVVTAGGASYPVKVVEGMRAKMATLASRPQQAGPQPVRAPMPGKVVKLLLRAGEAVKAGQGVLVIEAMKMENELKAPRDGTVAEVGVAEGQAVEAGQILATIG